MKTNRAKILSVGKIKSLFSYEDGYLVRIKNVSSRARIGGVAGTLNKRGYLQVRIEGRIFLVHRLIFAYHKNYFPEFIDHIDGNPLNNKIENLRACTKNENCRNSKTPMTNKSGVKGVHWCKNRNKWVSQIWVNNRPISLGGFDDLSEAEEIVRQARKLHHGEFCNHG